MHAFLQYITCRILQEIGTDGQHVADAEPTRLEQDIYGVVEGAVGGKGALVTVIGHLPEENEGEFKGFRDNLCHSCHEMQTVQGFEVF